MKSKVFSNQIEGWKALISWSQKNTQEGTDQLHFVMEATGVYHENFAPWLYAQGASVSVVNPAYVKHYAPGIGVRTKNDKANFSYIFQHLILYFLFSFIAFYLVFYLLL